jgi:hypothetical protein
VLEKHLHLGLSSLQSQNSFSTICPGQMQCQVPASSQPQSMLNPLKLLIAIYCIPSHSPKKEIAF